MATSDSLRDVHGGCRASAQSMRGRAAAGRRWRCLADISVEYDSKLDRGSTSGTFETVLHSIARARQLDDAGQALSSVIARAGNAPAAKLHQLAGRARAARPGQRAFDAVRSVRQIYGSHTCKAAVVLHPMRRQAAGRPRLRPQTGNGSCRLSGRAPHKPNAAAYRTPLRILGWERQQRHYEKRRRALTATVPPSLSKLSSKHCFSD